MPKGHAKAAQVRVSVDHSITLKTKNQKISQSVTHRCDRILGREREEHRYCDCEDDGGDVAEGL